MRRTRMKWLFLWNMLKHVTWREIKKKRPSLVRENLMGKRLLNPQETNDLIGNMIESGKPFSLIRPGSAEYSGAHEWIEHELLGDSRYKRQKLYAALGKNDDLLKKWTNGFVNDIKNADVIAFIGNPIYSMEFLCKCFSNTDKYMMSFYGTWDQSIKNPWFDKLSGKRVLFISPFVESMKKQWERYDKVCRDNKCLPLDMEPVFLKSVWYRYEENSEDGDFADWFEALDYLKKGLHELEFDIALISASTFSTFLATEIKQMGKQAIQYGGELQLAFGIMGHRWENEPFFTSKANEYWVRPSKEEGPKWAKNIEDGCYF